MKKKFFLIAFDISSDKKRRKVVKILENIGMRVQKSVFECFLDDKQFVKNKNKMDAVIDIKTDSIRYYQICENCRTAIKVSGKGVSNEEEDIIVI